jgi:thioesterase domain-containing protein
LTNEELTQYLHAQIPISVAMGVRVQSSANSLVELSAPFAPNVNHHGTVFGGSISALATLAGWVHAFVALQDLDPRPDLVVAASQTEYLRPAFGSIVARCEGGDYDRLRSGWMRFGRGRVDLSVTVRCEDIVVAEYAGQYAVRQP